MEFKIVKKKGHVLVVHLNGRMVGEFQTVTLNDDLEELMEEKYYRIVFDMSKLEYINSTALNFFLKMLTRVRRHDGEVILCCLNDLLKTLLVTTKLNSFFTISDSVEVALEHFAKEKA